MEVTESQRARAIQSSPTLAISSLAAKLRAQGQDIIPLSAGEPDFDTPEHIKKAAMRAIEQGKTRYTPVDGVPELKQAIIAKFQRENSLQFSEEQILASCGCKHSLYNLMQALINPGDEVLIPAPYWTSYPDMALLAGGCPVIISAGSEQGFKIQPEQLKKAITNRSRLLMLNSPNNPTGASYQKKELTALAEVLLEHPQLVIVSDDIYEHILWQEEPFQNLLNVCPQLSERVVICNGVSKAYAMTGWRIGYAAGPARLIAAMRKIQSQSTSNPNSIAQMATIAALQQDQAAVEENRRIFRERHDYVRERLQQLPGVSYLPGQGAFYAFPDLSELLTHNTKNIEDDAALAAFLLEQSGLALVPGSAFGAAGHLRLSFTVSMERLKEAMDRIQQAIEKELLIR